VAALRTSEQRFRRLFEANIIGIAFSDFSGQEIEANDAFLDLSGGPSERRRVLHPAEPAAL
jgi:PAS domain-containing protein